MTRHWTEREIAILKKYYPKISKVRLKNKLPRRSWSAIISKARRLGLNRKKFSTKHGTYFIRAYCYRHGWILRTKIKWSGKDNKIPLCPRPGCNRRLRVKPRTSKLRRKYKDV